VAAGFQLTLNDAGQLAAGAGGTLTIKGAGIVNLGSGTATTVAVTHTGSFVVDGARCQ